MRCTLKTRKPVYKLTADDLTTFPIWTFDHDESEHDETWVGPLNVEAIPKNAHALTVAARYYLRDGREFPGSAEIATVRELRFYRNSGGNWSEDPPRYLIQPRAIFVGRKTVTLPSEPEDDEGRKLMRKELGQPLSLVLPAWCELTLPIADARDLHREVIWE